VSLRIVGVGYRASLENFVSKPPQTSQTSQTSLTSQRSLRDVRDVKDATFLHFKLGYSHNLKYQLPESIRAFFLEPSLLCIFGIDKNQVSQLASKIRAFKPPERYKGKGIRFTNEKVALSQGKRK